VFLRNYFKLSEHLFAQFIVCFSNTGIRSGIERAIICDTPVVFDPEQVAQFNTVKSGTRSFEKLASAESLFLQNAHPKAVL